MNLTFFLSMHDNKQIIHTNLILVDYEIWYDMMQYCYIHFSTILPWYIVSLTSTYIKYNWEQKNNHLNLEYQLVKK